MRTWRRSGSRRAARSARNAAWSAQAAASAGCGSWAARVARVSAWECRSTGWVDTTIWVGGVSELSHRPNVSISAACSSAVRRARLTVVAATIAAFVAAEGDLAVVVDGLGGQPSAVPAAALRRRVLTQSGAVVAVSVVDKACGALVSDRVEQPHVERQPVAAARPRARRSGHRPRRRRQQHRHGSSECRRCQPAERTTAATARIASCRKVSP